MDGAAGRRLVLVADDDAAIRQLIRDCLVGDGFRCLGCADGLELMGALALVRPALIVLDVRMPRLGGHGVLARMRADPALRAVPVVATRPRPGRCWRPGCRAFLAKPFDLDVLLGAVRAALGEPRGWPAAVARARFRCYAAGVARKERPPVVAVVNSSEDVVTLIRQVLEEEGFSTVAGHVPHFKSGKDDLLAFLESHDPAAVVFDVAPPYEDNWRFLQLVRDTRSAEGRAFVVTTTNKAQLEKQVGDTGAIEVVGKPFDLQEIAGAVKRALGRG